MSDLLNGECMLLNVFKIQLVIIIIVLIVVMIFIMLYNS